MPCSGPSLDEAKQWLPPGASLMKDSLRENRWRIRFNSLPGGVKPKSFGRHSSPCSRLGSLFFRVLRRLRSPPAVLAKVFEGPNGGGRYGSELRHVSKLGFPRASLVAGCHVGGNPGVSHILFLAGVPSEAGSRLVWDSCIGVFLSC